MLRSKLDVKLEGWKSFDGKLCTLYDIKDRIIMKRTKSRQCSYVELQK